MTTVAERGERIETRSGIGLPSIHNVEEQIEELADYCDVQADRVRGGTPFSAMEWQDLADKLRGIGAASDGFARNI